jgi:predicted RNA-binding protein with TRAM domain
LYKQCYTKITASPRTTPCEKQSISRTISALFISQLKVGDTFQAEVMGLSPTGDGVVKTDSKVIFVPLAIPGQKIVGKIIRRKKRVFFGETEEVIKKSPHEENPKDPEFPHHGGAPWQCIEYKEQLKWKEQFVRDAFERIAGIQDPPVEEIVESPITERYRNKMEFSFGHSQMRTETDEQGNKTHFDEQPGLGLHRRGKLARNSTDNRHLPGKQRNDEYKRHHRTLCNGNRKTRLEPNPQYWLLAACDGA